MVYAYDNWVQLPTKDIYDTQMMAMAINAAKDMYEKGQDEIKDFTKTYGDFMSPFAKDMERYGEMVGGVRDTINRMYAAGIDPLRSAEGRAMLSRLTNSINPAEFNMMRANAKTGYAYLDAIQDLRRKGKYSEAQELFDIMQTGGLGTDSEGNSINTFENFSTAGRGGWNSFTRTSPIEAATLQELTKSGYEGRTARLLSAADFNDPRLKGYTYDPNYEWSGYLYSDLLKGAPGAVMSASADPRMAYFRNLAEQKVAASGLPYTQADVEAQFQRDVADANTWALIDPTRKANEFALDDHRTKNDDWLDQRKSARDLNNALALERFKAENGGRGYSRSSSSGSGGSGGGKESFSEAQYQLESGTTNILGKTSWGRASGISTYQDFDPEKLNFLLPAAQAEIAWKHYDNSISGGNGATVTGKSKKQNLFNWNKETGKFEPNTPGAIYIGAGVDITTELGGEYKPATTNDQIKALKAANRSFIDDLSTSYTPAKFAQWTNKSTITGDNSMVNITRDQDALDRIYSIDEVALDSYGTGRPKEDLNWAKTLTNSTRKLLGNISKNRDGRELCIKSIGKQVTKVAKDGAVHQYQLCKVYERTPKGNKYEEVNKGELIAYDMGVDTYSNPNFGINNNTDINLYFDEAKDADTRWTGDQNVLHWEHVTPPAINSTIAYPQLPMWNFETSNWE